MNQLLNQIISLTMQKVLFFGLVLAGSYFFFFTYDNYNNLHAREHAVLQEIAREKEIQKDTDSTLKKELEVKDSVAALSQQFEKIAKSLPTVLTQSDIMAFIDIFSKESAVKVTLKSPLPSTKMEVIEVLPVTVHLKGTYFEIGRFIQRVSVFEPITRVSDYRIVRDAINSGVYNFEGKILGYRSLDLKQEEVKK